MAKVWNDNVHEFTQVFKGETITIPPKKFVEMEYYDAHKFVSSYSPRIMTGQGDDPAGYKMLRVEGHHDEAKAVRSYQSFVDGSLHSSVAARDAYDSKYAHLREEPESIPVAEETKVTKKTKNV